MSREEELRCVISDLCNQVRERDAEIARLRTLAAPVAKVVSKFGDPEAFGERELVAIADIQKMPYGTKLYAAPQPAVPDGRQSDAERDVLAERRRQVEAEGWTPEHDDAHGDGSMCMAAVCYAEWDHYEHPNGDGEGLIPINWPWSAKWWKPRDRRRNLVKAAALLLAEIERMDRASTSTLEPSK